VPGVFNAGVTKLVLVARTDPPEEAAYQRIVLALAAGVAESDEVLP
jgi:hypothetical protein